jgi:hypothetical protein
LVRPAALESRRTSRAEGRADIARADTELSLERSAHPLAAGKAALSSDRLEWAGRRREQGPMMSRSIGRQYALFGKPAANPGTTFPQ